MFKYSQLFNGAMQALYFIGKGRQTCMYSNIGYSLSVSEDNVEYQAHR